MEGKTVKASALVTAQVMGPQDVNLAGNIHGGVIMKLIDVAAGSVAIRHARSNAVTASIDRLDFHYPIYPGDLVTCKASLNMVGKTSMEIGVRVEAEDLITGDVRHTASAYLSFVALDKAGRPLPVPPLILETDEDRRRNQEAHIRREVRLREAREHKKNKENMKNG
jgi:uncharacterized protein (TIGR00369 family)